MQNDILISMIIDRRHHEMIEEANQARLLKQIKSGVARRTFRERLGDFLIDLGYRLKNANASMVPHIPSTEMTR